MTICTHLKPMYARTKKLTMTLIPGIMLALTSACVTIPGNSERGNRSIAEFELEAPIYDPWESVNRQIFTFNSYADRYFLKPVATAYQFVMPSFAESAVRNFFNNLEDVPTSLNALLQGKFHQAGSDGTRFIVNSTLGLGGLLDIASRGGLPKNYETFGQTLGVWGVKEGPFIVLPFIGPSNFRSTVGRVASAPVNWPNWVDEPERYGLQVADIVSFRAALLGASDVFEQAALDRYTFLRDFWIRNHRLDVLDREHSRTPGGNRPNSGDPLDDLDDLDDLDRLDELDELYNLDAPDQSDSL